MINFELDNEPLYFQSEFLTCQVGEGMLSWIKHNRTMLRNMKGVYYYTSNDETIYIGKAKDLYGRMMHHCKEMLPHLCTEAKRKKDTKFIDAFSQFGEEEVEVYFIPLDDEVDRQWLENKMQLKHNTVFKHGIQKSKHL
jgi:excinuclease UvrABC nuclease subunit